MRYDAKYKVIAHAVVRELMAHGGGYAGPFLNNDEVIFYLGMAIQRAMQKEQLKDICRDLDLELPKGVEQ